MIEEMLVGCYLNELDRTLARAALIVEARRLHRRGRTQARLIPAVEAQAAACRGAGVRFTAG